MRMDRWCWSFFMLTLCAAWLILGLGCTTVSRPPEHAEVIGDEARAILPGEFENGMFVADASINGVPGFRMLIDTGADATVLTPEALQRLQSGRTSAFVPTFGGGGGAGLIRGQQRVDTMELGSFQLRGFHAAEFDLSRVQSAFDEPIDGVVGWPAFRDVALVVDYPRGEVFVEPSDTSISPSDADTYALVGKRSQIAIPVQGKPRRVTVDTGASGTITLKARDLREGSYVLGEPFIMRGVHAKRTAHYARLKDNFEFAGATLPELPIMIGENIRRILGLEMMRPFAVRFDQPAGVIRFARNDSASGSVSATAVDAAEASESRSSHEE